ncbi:MAG: hypothetical protein J0H60_06295, partial [Rhizobiales bacterium]|nr:hypothetical protein [Hyphomicrobiales bacterium]
MDDKEKSRERPRTEGAKRQIPPSAGETGGSERIAKRLARAGISSRREAEALIADGRVRVNGT